MRPVPYPKKINPKEKVYYHYQVNKRTQIYALYDGELNTPIIYGTKNMVARTIVEKLPINCVIFYYETDGMTGWKMKRRYTPSNETVEVAEGKEKVENMEEKKKELT